MPSSNEELFDAALRHQIALRGYSAGLARRIAEFLAEADADLTTQLQVRLAKFADKDIDWTGERWQALIADIREARRAAFAQFRQTVRDELAQLAAQEAQTELDALGASVPIEISFATVAADQLRAIVSSKPFQGKLLKDWFATLERVDQDRLVTAVQLGMSQGEPIPQLVRRVVGTKAAQYTDGILSITRRDATAIVRTAVNFVSNEARDYVWQANADVITARVWVSTLDGRTSAMCRARDGCGTPVGGHSLPTWMRLLKPENAKPPGHINCRSCMVAYIDGEALLGNRPFVIDTRTPDKRRIDFRAEAKATGKDERDIRKAWAVENIGRVPSSTTYQEFLTRQSAAFQDEVLGKTKGKLFRTGEITVQEFVDRRGNELTLAQLAKKRPDAFRAAGL